MDTRITAERLRLVEAAEEFLRRQGLHQVRVRYYPIAQEVTPAVGRGFRAPPSPAAAGAGWPGRARLRERGRPATASAGDRAPALQKDYAMARIEVGEEELPRLLDTAFRQRVVARLKTIGFLYVTLDLQGYRTGSMNETLERQS